MKHRNANRRQALDALILWTGVMLAVACLGGAAIAGNAVDVPAWAEGSAYVAVAVAAFSIWFVGLQTIALVTIIVRLGHLTQALPQPGDPQHAARPGSSEPGPR